MRIPRNMLFAVVAITCVFSYCTASSQGDDSWPKVTREPVLAGPDSLLPKNHRVRMIVEAEVDLSGMPTNPKVTWSTDRRFDVLARGYALQYRFEPAVRTGAKARRVRIPMVFMNPPIRKLGQH